MHDFWGRPLPRPIAPGLLRSAIRRHLSQAPNLLLEALQRLDRRPTCASDLVWIKVRLFQEGDFQFIFRVTVRRRTGGQTQLAMVVAKEGTKVSRLARRELDNLHHLHQRDERFVVQPLGGGALALDPAGPPHRAALFIYFTRWLTGMHELGVDRRMNFYINEIPFHTFRTAVSDLIRGQILSILFGYWDPASGTAMEPPQIASGDFVISRPAPGKPLRLRLIACRKLVPRVSLARCLRLYLGYHGQWAGKVFHFMPKEPKHLFDALDQGVVAKNPGAFPWAKVERELRIYADELEHSAGAHQEWSPLPGLRRLIACLPALRRNPPP